MVASEYPQGVSVIADDTDVFILLIHHFLEQQLTNFIVMESPIHDRSVIDICSTVKNEEQIAHDLLACNALSGCDTVACYYGIGKVKAIKTLRTGFSLSCLGYIHVSLPDVTKQAT